MQIEQDKSRSSSWGPLLLCALVICSLLFVATVGILRSRPRTVLHGSAIPLIGSWTMSDPQGPGTRVLTFKRDGQIRSKDVSDESGTVLNETTGEWYVDGQTLVIRVDRRGIASLLDSIPAVAPIETVETAIISVSEDELLLGNQDDPIRYERTGSEPSSPAH